MPFFRFTARRRRLRCAEPMIRRESADVDAVAADTPARRHATLIADGVVMAAYKIR